MTQVNSYMASHNISTDALFETTKEMPNIKNLLDNKVFVAFAILAFMLSTKLYHYFFVHDQPPKGSGLKLMPGPTSTIPYIGRVHDVDPQAPWFAMKKFCDQYNGIFRNTICGEMHIWVGDQKIGYDLLCKKARIYSSRPQVPAVPGSDSQGQYLPLLAHDGKADRLCF